MRKLLSNGNQLEDGHKHSIVCNPTPSFSLPPQPPQFLFSDLSVKNSCLNQMNSLVRALQETQFFAFLFKVGANTYEQKVCIFKENVLLHQNKEIPSVSQLWQHSRDFEE